MPRRLLRFLLTTALISLFAELTTQPAAAQEIDVTPTSKAFGNQDIDEGATSAQVFTIDNLDGSNTLTVDMIVLTGTNASDFTITVNPASVVIAASGSAAVSVVFNPSSTGSKTATLEIHNDDLTGSEDPFDISLSGTGTDQSVSVPSSNNFPDKDIDEGATLGASLTIDNSSGTAALIIIGVVLGVLAGVVAFMLPASYIRMMRRRRVARIEKQLIELSPMLASSLRSGFALQQGLELAQQQLGPPLADELNLLLQDINLGASMEGALQDFGQRIGSTDLDMLITAILVQRATGGNLSEIFDQTAETLREREQIRGELNTLTAQQRLTGWVLSIYPTGIGLVLLALVPSIWSKLFTETAGLVLLGIAVGLQLLGVFFMRRLMDIKI